MIKFNKELRAPEPSAVALWELLEGLALLISTEHQWYGVDDSETVLENLRMIGVAAFATLKVLKANNLLGPNSPVKNIALVLGVLRDELEAWPAQQEEPELAWGDYIVEEAQAHGIAFKGAPFGIETRLGSGLHRDQEGQSLAKWKALDWKKEVNLCTIK